MLFTNFINKNNGKFMAKLNKSLVANFDNKYSTYRTNRKYLVKHNYIPTLYFLNIFYLTKTEI